MGPTSGQYRVLRGGSWVFFPKIVRAALRHSRNPEGRYDNAGFRCASSS
jgi:formylglycine-generating enzyme required for sulfatase activity